MQQYLPSPTNRTAEKFNLILKVCDKCGLKLCKTVQINIEFTVRNLERMHSTGT